MNERPLISMAILSYKNYKYIKEALDSVFIQDYPNIQLIISNDGSDDFDESDLILYINNNRKENIQSVYINNNECNIGTVKNVNLVRSKADGEFLMLMAADDALYDEYVLSRFVDEFKRLGPDAYIVSARTAMCGHDLSEVIEIFPDDEGIKAIKTLSSQEMFSRLSHTFTIPTTSTCYRMSLYDRIGEYNEDYFIIEDAPLFVKLARLGYKFYWIDDMIAARHRDGGISHGNVNSLSEAYRKYQYDEILIYKNEILPYKSMILKRDYKQMLRKWKYINHAYQQTYILPNLHGKEKIQHYIKTSPLLIRKFLKRTKEKVIELSYDDYFCKIFLILILFSFIDYIMLYSGLFIPVTGIGLGNNLLLFFGSITLLCSILLFLMYVIRIVYRLYLAVKYIILGR
ncbi:hypothetical protein AT727_02490 [Desulfitobacterium hafniense]|uniref:Glycosyltransferase 2-like domain-containing protein n=1 Tax=Desulfitobacterium hafniense TaxID=49338 RepID=A0A0W1JQA3_DESHA|nr:glycosyltransferase [Desulfitobacterium hafniense]KTE93843.1 hypothetical protein AT727_02490 [Desulfitobacterium hafniense]